MRKVQRWRKGGQYAGCVHEHRALLVCGQPLILKFSLRIGLIHYCDLAPGVLNAISG